MNRSSVFLMAFVVTIFLAFTPGLSTACMSSVDGDIVAQGFPAGTEAALNHRCRFEGVQGPMGGVGLSYRGGTDDLNEFLERYAAIDFTTLELVVLDGTATTFFRRQPLDWDLVLEEAIGEERYRRYCVTVHLGEGSIVWEDVSIPGELNLVDLRREALKEETRMYLGRFSSIGIDVKPGYDRGLIHFDAHERGTDHRFAGKGRTELDALEDLARDVWLNSDHVRWVGNAK